MIINGVDYSLYIIAVVSFVVLAVAEYFICIKAKNPSTRKILLFIPFIILVAGLLIYGSESTGFLDLRGIILILFTGYALICSAGLLTGWLVFKLNNKKVREIPESCPYAENSDK